MAFGTGVGAGDLVEAVSNGTLVGSPLADNRGDWLIAIEENSADLSTDEIITFNLNGTSTQASVRWGAGGFPPDLQIGIELGVATEEVVPLPGTGFDADDLASSQMLLSYPGGSLEQLERGARAAVTVAIGATVEGRFVWLVAGDTSFINREFQHAFPDGIPPDTLLILDRGAV
jgi:hypothetical protein